MPCLERIRARRQIVQIKAAVLACHHKIRMLEYSDVAFHPRMYIALHGNCDFFTSERIFYLCAGQFGFVPLAIVSRDGMNVVRGRIPVYHFQLLIGVHGDHVRLVHAALLLYDRGLAWRIIGAIGQSVSHKDDYVLQSTFSVGHNILRKHGSRVQLGAARVGAMLIDFPFGTVPSSFTTPRTLADADPVLKEADGWARCPATC